MGGGGGGELERYDDSRYVRSKGRGKGNAWSILRDVVSIFCETGDHKLQGKGLEGSELGR